MATETRFSEQRLHVFRDEFFDAQFMRALTYQAFGGAALDEILLRTTGGTATREET